MKHLHKILLGYLALEILLALLLLFWGGSPHRAPMGFGDQLHRALAFTFDMTFLLDLVLLIWVGNGLLNRYYGYGNSALFDRLCWLTLGVALFPFVYLCALVLFR
ncbi:MAG TPA: hypothetical protein VGC22_14530 [Chitinophaga sp.]